MVMNVYPHKARMLVASDIPMDRPVIAMDIDGVLNAYDHGRELEPWQMPVEEEPVLFPIGHSERVTLPQEMCDEYGFESGKSVRITWSDELMEAIAGLADSGRASVVWLSTWNGFAGFLAWELFWPNRPSPVLGYLDCLMGGRRDSYIGKTAALDSICDAMRAAHPDDERSCVVSFDDERPWETRMWNDPRALPMPAFFMGIGTDPRHGITRSQWESMLEEIGL